METPPFGKEAILLYLYYLYSLSTYHRQRFKSSSMCVIPFTIGLMAARSGRSSYSVTIRILPEFFLVSSYFCLVFTLITFQGCLVKTTTTVTVFTNIYNEIRINKYFLLSWCKLFSMTEVEFWDHWMCGVSDKQIVEKCKFYQVR